jgi:hypothetical protein
MLRIGLGRIPPRPALLGKSGTSFETASYLQPFSLFVKTAVDLSKDFSQFVTEEPWYGLSVRYFTTPEAVLGKLISAQPNL